MTGRYKCDRCGKRGAPFPLFRCDRCRDIVTCDRCGADVDHEYECFARLCMKCWKEEFGGPELAIAQELMGEP